MRLFVALDVPDAVRGPLDAAVAGLRDRWDGLRWTPPEQWHVTLAFIGDVDVPVDEVVAALGPAARSAPPEIELALTAPGRFGRRVLWVGVADEPEDAVGDLGTAVQRSLGAAGLPVDDRPVHPHVTLARARRRVAARIGPEVVDAIPAVPGQWSVRELVLLDSVPQGRGQPNRYEPRARVPFAV